MANKKSSNKNLILGTCAAIAVLVIIVIAIVLGIRNGGFGGLNDSYFVSDGSKYVIEMTIGDLETEDDTYLPTKAYIVYAYSGDEITGRKIYYQYDDSDQAKAAYDYFVSIDEKSRYKSLIQDGKYVIFESNESDYEGITATNVKDQVEYINALKEIKPSDEATEESDQPTEESDIETIEEIESTEPTAPEATENTETPEVPAE